MLSTRRNYPLTHRGHYLHRGTLSVILAEEKIARVHWGWTSHRRSSTSQSQLRAQTIESNYHTLINKGLTIFIFQVEKNNKCKYTHSKLGIINRCLGNILKKSRRVLRCVGVYSYLLRMSSNMHLQKRKVFELFATRSTR